MRDPNRIPTILELLRQAWESNPDQRLGQLVINACREITENELPSRADMWFCEDDCWELGIRRMLTKIDSSWPTSGTECKAATDRKTPDVGANA